MARVSSTRTKLAGLDGLQELDRKTKKLIEVVIRSDGAKQINRRAAEAGLAIIRAGAPSPTGATLAKGWTPLRETIRIVQVGMPVYIKQFHKENPTGLWMEHGTAHRAHKTGKSVGRMPASNWWSKGRNRSRSVVRGILKAGYQELVESVPRGN